MAFELMDLLGGSLVQKQAATEIMDCNQFSLNYGLILTMEQATELVETRSVSLRANGRIEFGGGVIDKLIHAFAPSPYLTRQNYATTLHELTELFYYFKNEMDERISDDALISFMAKAFDNPCQGSLELLAGRELPNLIRLVRFGEPESTDESPEDKEDENNG